MNNSLENILTNAKIALQKSNSEIIGDKKEKDETYVINLCDEVLNERASRQHRFAFLTGDTGRKLPVDAYYAKQHLVVEYYEKQHTESVKLFDKKKTASGVTRDIQRRIYDERRKKIIPKYGIELIIISYGDFEFNSQKKIIRNKERDLNIVCQKLKKFISNKKI